MHDIMKELARLHEGTLDEASDATVAGDIERGRRALRARRVRRGSVATIGVLALGAIGSLVYASTSDDATRQTAAPRHTAMPQHTATQPPTVSQPAPTTPAPASIQLVAYDGKQPQGFRIKYVPRGYVLQGVSGADLEIAEKGNHSSLDDFVGKIVVGLDNDQPDTGQPVQVGSRPGHYREDESGIATLTYRVRGNTVVIQKWSNIELTKAQLVDFAAGVTVTKDAQLSHG